MDVDDDDSTGEPLVRVKTNDGKRFSLTKSEACCSRTLKRMIESAKLQAQSDIEIQVPVNGKPFSQVLKWCQEHFDVDNDEAGEISEEAREEQAEWDKKFLASFREEELLRVMHVANYLDIVSLHEACCRIFAKKWENSKVDEIRKMYGIENDFSSDEERFIVLENKKLGLND